MKTFDGTKWISTEDTYDLSKKDVGYVEPKLMVAFRSYPGITNEWMQGFNINESEGHYYLGLQNSSKYTIVRIDMRTGSYVDSSSFNCPEGAFSESLPYWKNTSGQLCFMVRTGVGATESTYNIFNYVTKEMSPQISINGIWRAGQSEGILVTSDARSVNVGVFYVYDWESVKSGSPHLITKIYPETIGTASLKNQGLQGTADSIVVQQASVFDPPTLVEYSYLGKVKSTTSWSLPEFGRLINNNFPGAIADISNFKSEGEGLAVSNNVLHSLWTINEGSLARAVIFAHGTPKSTAPKNNRINQVQTMEYITTLNDGGGTVKLVKEGRRVVIFIDGIISIPARTNKALFSVPNEFVPLNNQRIFLNCISSDTSSAVQSALYVGTSKWMTAENKGNVVISAISRSVSTYDLYI